MPITFERAVFKSGDSYRITIPMEIIKALNIKEKSLKISIDEPNILSGKEANDGSGK
jgi:bifunctional DNA-binding transcriptional regulator/antitoxin component of YhaV-PrlF toxin-antitoxin module